MTAPVESIKHAIFNPNPNMQIELLVVIGKKDHHGERRKFMREWVYDSTKYNGVNSLTSINIGTDEYLVFRSQLDRNQADYTPGWRAKEVFFSYDNLYRLEWACNQALAWLYNENDSVFQSSKVDGMPASIQRQAMNLRIIVESPYFPVYSNAPLTIYPTIRTLADDAKEKAVMFAFGKNVEEIASFNIDELSKITYFLSRFDLCSTSINLVNQTLIGLPWIRGNKK